MKRLTEIGINLGTDKAEYHQFTELYDDYFTEIAQRVENPRILEIGILDGASLKMYDAFFNGKAKIYGVDIAEKGHLFKGSNTILSIRADIMDPTAIEKIKRAANGEKFDIIIDDGSHFMEDQQKTLVNLWPMLNEGGLFIVEDLHTSGNEDFNPHKTVTTLAMLKGLAVDNNPEFLPSLYVDEATLKGMYEEMETCAIGEIDFPQVRTQAARVSITSLIRKRSGLSNVTIDDSIYGLPKEMPLDGPKVVLHENVRSMEEIEKEWEENNSETFKSQEMSDLQLQQAEGRMNRNSQPVHIVVDPEPHDTNITFEDSKQADPNETQDKKS